ncbi:MAG: hypothetical protein QF384_11390 [Alphaproteobacteria bacterium]|nr:hypothetical protein [Alphaproteobacteria bacterium]MDP6832697.1 hypothetical protein [Alphaproteobacteria bacterium]MDP6875651.1 hypothetical protein [Alphaproteobacteria bacterium]
MAAPQPFFAAQGLHGAHDFLAAHGLHAFFAAQGLQAPQLFFAAQGLQAFLAAQGLQAPQPRLPAQGLQAPQPFFAAQGLSAAFSNRGTAHFSEALAAAHGLQAPHGLQALADLHGLHDLHGLQARHAAASRIAALGSGAGFFAAAYLGEWSSANGAIVTASGSSAVPNSRLFRSPMIVPLALRLSWRESGRWWLRRR